MKVALVGFRGAGKTSVFNALTGLDKETGVGRKDASNLGEIEVPDARVTSLSEIYQPKKTTYAKIQFVDVAGPEGSERGAGLDAALVSAIREAEALVLVARGFENPMLADASSHPVSDIGAFADELILTDLVQIEKRVERLKKEKRGKELELLEKLHAGLEEGQSIRRQNLDDGELGLVSGFAFLSLKPMLVVLNQSEDDLGNPPPDDVVKEAEARGFDLFALCATMEAEIMSMAPDDQKAFLEDLGLAEPVRTRFIQAAYGMLDLISFLTTGEDEVRAWTIRRGTAAKQAAGKIHSDLERGFIRAEVTAATDFLELGSEAKVKEAGKARLEGKEYAVKDGDIMHIRHNT